MDFALSYVVSWVDGISATEGFQMATTLHVCEAGKLAGRYNVEEDPYSACVTPTYKIYEQSNWELYITYCPFCGKKLVKEASSL